MPGGRASASAMQPWLRLAQARQGLPSRQLKDLQTDRMQDTPRKRHDRLGVPAVVEVLICLVEKTGCHND
jgi:hypothetical protein